MFNEKNTENLLPDNVSVKGISLHTCKITIKGKFNMIARRMTSQQH